MNYIDLAIILILIYYIYDGYRRGLFNVALELAVFLISILAAFLLSTVVGNVLVNLISLPKVYNTALGFVVVWFLVQLALSLLKGWVSITIGGKWEKVKWNKYGGVAASLIRGSIFIWFILLFVTVLPVSGEIRNKVGSSAIGSRLVNNGGNIDYALSRIFGKTANDMVTFLTIDPFTKNQLKPQETILKPNESLELGYKTTDVKEEPISAKKMLVLVNKARYEAGLPSLMMDDKLQRVALAHAKDMFARGYFSHITPDGVDPFTRMVNFGVDYQAAGENLALAPTVELAHNGLMNSSGHRENILQKKFGKVGIGVLDAGVYGKMFVQEFTN